MMDYLNILVNVANDMRTSFLRSLEIIAARIPAQSQQSFMSMQVEQFDNPDINSCLCKYIPILFTRF